MPAGRLILQLIGLVGTAHEMLFGGGRPALLVLFAGMMAIPAFDRVPIPRRRPAVMRNELIPGTRAWHRARWEKDQRERVADMRPAEEKP